jgi:hypothetical protein
MYERSYGDKFAETKDLRTVEIAKLVRADVKAAKAAGELPADLNVSVRYESASMMTAIRVAVLDAPELWEPCPGYRLNPGSDVGTGCPSPGCPETYTHDRLTAEGLRITGILEAILNSYNYDGSDIMTDYFDVRFYSTVTIEDAWSIEWRAREKARKAAKAAARKVAR